MRSTFIPTITGRIVEITEGAEYAADWTIDEAVERLKRLTEDAHELACEARLALTHGHRDPRVLAANAANRINEAIRLRDAIRKFIPAA